MPTKCIVIGQENAEPKKLKPIEFVKKTTGHLKESKLLKADWPPSSYANIELISKSLDPNFYDTMFAYNRSREAGMIYYGYWNDGVVEEK